MATNILTNDWQVKQAKLFANSLSNSYSYYMFLADPVPRQTNAIPDVFDDTLTTEVATYRNMIIGKAVTNSDVSLVIRNIPYVTNTVYAKYDDGNANMFSSSYYAIVNAGSFYHVWKVLNDNMGNPSTVAPNIEDIGANDESYQTSDGYQWKYMYSVDTFTAQTFSTTYWFPLLPNTSVVETAVPGAIDVIEVDSGGAGYNNWLTGTFGSQDVMVSGNSLLYAISGNSTANTLPGFYTGCIIYISSGAGVGEFSTIVSSFANPNGTFVVLQNALIPAPQNGSQYEIYPEVTIKGDGFQTVNAVARALVNSVGNTIYQVEMINRGEGYQYMLANVIANSVVGVSSQANVRPIFGPFGGHGHDAAAELGATAVCVAVKIANSESNTVPATNDYQQIGLLYSPLFSNVIVNLSFVQGVPIVNEQGWVLEQTRLLVSNATVSQGSNILTSNSTTNVSASISVNDVLYIKSGDTTKQQLVNVSSVTNSSQVVLSQNALWSCTSTQVFLATLSSGFVLANAVSSNVWAITNVTPVIQANDFLIFSQSGALGNVSTVTRSGVVKDFSTFIGMYSYTGTIVSGVFQQNEPVYQGISYANSTANASLFAALANNTDYAIYTSNQVGQFSNVGFDTTIIGVNSGAVANLQSEWSPEIVFGSGDVFYLENIDALSRSNTTDDNLVVVISF